MHQPHTTMVRHRKWKQTAHFHTGPQSHSGVIQKKKRQYKMLVTYCVRAVCVCVCLTTLGGNGKRWHRTGDNHRAIWRIVRIVSSRIVPCGDKHGTPTSILIAPQ